MTEQDNLTSTSDERMMGALAHFFGMLAALVIWAIQKDKSRFVRFQAAQALAFDFAVMLLMVLFFACFIGFMLIGMFGTMFAAFNSASSSESFSRFMAFPMLLPFFAFTCIFPVSLAIFVARVVAAISVLSGNNFHFPFLGAKVEKFLADQA